MNLTNKCHLSPVHAIALMSTNSLTAVLGTFGNVLVCIAVITIPRLRKISNFLLFSLAVADLIVTVACAPLLVAMIGKLAFAHKCPTNLELAYYNTGNLSFTSSILHLAAISVDRFLAVVFPLRHNKIMKTYGLKIMLVAVWGIAILFTAIRVVDETSILAFVLFVLSYLIITVSYASIFIFLMKERGKRKYLRGTESRPDAITSNVERRVAFTLAIVILVFSACWFPLITTFFASGKHLVKVHGPAFMWIRTLAVSNSAMNFLIYSWRIGDFREAYVKIFRRVIGRGSA